MIEKKLFESTELDRKVTRLQIKFTCPTLYKTLIGLDTIIIGNPRVRKVSTMAFRHKLEDTASLTYNILNQYNKKNKFLFIY